jgi:DHA1 family bicyclomycin/chloramphenicol resistance-like MFS transporter
VVVLVDDDVQEAPPPRRQAALESREFVALMALCMGMAALSIDLMLPAFADMREDFGLAADSTAVSWVLTAFFLGLAAGQLIYGPLSDRFGRKPMLYAGLAVYVVSGTAAAFMPSLTGLVVCRVLWGLGAAAPRSLALAMIRDAYGGERMARTMSLVMAIFILVPVFAPGVGALALVVAPWRALLLIPVAAAIGLALWARRLPETLPPERRRSVAPAALLQAFGAVVRNRQTAGFALVVTCLFGIMTSFIGSFEIIVTDVFAQKDAFPVIFGLLAATLGAGALLSARLVVQVGLHRLLRHTAVYLLAVAAALATLALVTGGEPPLWAFVLLLGALLPGMSVLLPNSNSAAMAPLPHVAGMASAVLGTISTAGGAVLGSVIDAAFDGTVRPFAFGVLVFATVAAGTILVVARRPALVRVETGVPAPVEGVA